MAGLDLTISGSRTNALLSPDKSDMETSPYKSSDSTSSTPRKNKRKSSEPKRRSDFSIKRFCPDTPHALGHELDTEDGGGRPGYGEHPPSTPETSASSSTPSPPDATQLRVPNVPRHRSNASPTHTMTSSSPETVTPHAQEHTLSRQAYVPPYGLNMAYMPVNPVLLQHMLAMQQQSIVPVVMQQPLANTATSSQLPVHSSTQLPSATQSRPVPSGGATIPQHGQLNRPAPSQSTAIPSGSKIPSRPQTSRSRDPRERTQSTSNTSRDLSNSRTSNDSLNVSTTSQFSDSLCHSDNEGDFDGSRRSRKNYKNMTRERRIEANARERSRVHTISAAFETLRRSVPSFSHTQRLSKLAILRIACSYISALANMAGHDLSPPGHSPESLEECVDQCTKTIQNEGRAKRRH